MTAHDLSRQTGVLARRLRRWLLGPLGTAIVLSLLVLAGAVLALVRERERALDSEAQRLTAWAESLVSDTQRTLFDAELQLAAAERWLDGAGATVSPEAFDRVATTREAHEMLFRVVSNAHSTGGMFLVNARGQRVASQRVFPTARSDLSDREHFIQARDRAEAGTVITAPSKNLQTGSPTVFVARRVVGPTPAFVGTVAANVPLARFQRLFDDVEATGRQVGVVRTDGRLLLTGVDSGTVIEGLLASGAAALSARLTAVADGQWLDMTARGEPFVVVGRPLVGHPLGVVVATPHATVLAPWRQQVLLVGLLSAGLMVAVWLVGLQATQRARREQALLDAVGLSAANAELRREAAARQTAQAALERNNAALEALVAQRTADLEQALKAAQAASQAKSRFVSHMSHELRTPLNAVIGYVQLLEQDSAAGWTPEQRAHLEHIAAGAEQVLELISDVLDLARVETGELAVSLEPVRLAAVIDDVVRTVAPTARAHGVRVEVDAPDASATATADPRRLRQVLLNLTSNAIKYNRPDGRVRVVVTPAPPPAAAWTVAVEDTGRGIEPERQAELFQPFNRLGAEQGSIEGTGIGLVITRHLVERMGATLAMRSEPGVGSVFSVTLAAATPGADPAPSAAAAPPPAAAPAPTAAAPGADAAHDDASRRDVLYVEDNAMNVALVRSMFERRKDLVLHVAASAAEAREVLLTLRPDVLLLDMNLGDAHGVELLSVLRAEGLIDGVRCLALSADAMPEQIAAAEAAGIERYLTKPVRMAALFQAIDTPLVR